MPVRVRERARSGLGLSVALLVVASGVVAACQAPGGEALDRSGAPIIGGELDTTTKGVVSLLKQVPGGFFPSCSGTLLTQNLVLTAHHCVASLSSPDGASVECGRTEFTQTERASSLLVSIEANVGHEGLEPYRVAKVWVPEGDRGVCGRDIAMLLLAGSGVPASAATPIEPRLTSEVKRNEEFAAIGYGLQDPTDYHAETAGHRMGVDDARVFCTGAACNTELVHASEWIADSPVCSGDSGGPALNADGQIVGVTSRGDADCTLGIYTSVYAWRDFIREKTFEAAESGHYSPPAWAGEPPPGFDPGLPTGGTGGSGASSSGGGAVIAGGPGASGSNSGAPVVSPLGSTCAGECPGAYRCWSETGEPPGICVPTCSAEKACPADYTCNDGLGACVPASTLDDPAQSGCSVAYAGDHGDSASAWWAALAAMVAAATRRKRRA